MFNRYFKKSASGIISNIGNFPDIPDSVGSHSYINIPSSVSLLESSLSFAEMELMYRVNPWVRACIDKITERSLNINPVVKPVNVTSSKDITDETKRNMDIVYTMLEGVNSEYESLNDIRRKYVRDLMKFDASAIERVTSKSNKDIKIELYSVPGNSIKKNLDKHGRYIREKAFSQIDRSGKSIAHFPIHKLMYSALNQQSNKNYGLSPLETLQQTVTAELYSSQYNLDFFSNSATPRIAVMMDEVGLGHGSISVQRFRKYWESELQGQPHKPIVLSSEKGKIRIENVAVSNSDMEFMKYSAWLLLKIMAVYKVQPAVLGFDFSDTMTNRSDTSEQIAQFKVEAINPILSTFFEKLNIYTVFNEQGFGLKDVYIDYDLDIVDRSKQSEWHEVYLRSGVLTINEIRQEGLGLPPVPYGDVPYLQNNVAPFGEGRNGSALPITTDKSMLKSLPVGWENMSKTEKRDILLKMAKERHRILSKRYFY
jgi:HK97 family phage portal protein